MKVIPSNASAGRVSAKPGLWAKRLNIQEQLDHGSLYIISPTSAFHPLDKVSSTDFLGEYFTRQSHWMATDVCKIMAATTVYVSVTIYAGDPVDYPRYRHTSLFLEFANQGPSALVHVWGQSESLSSPFKMAMIHPKTVHSPGKSTWAVDLSRTIDQISPDSCAQSRYTIARIQLPKLGRACTQEVDDLKHAVE